MYRSFKSALTLALLLVVLLQSNINAQQETNFDPGELHIALQKLNVLGSVLMIAAHPDDENTAALAHFAKSGKYRTAYLAMTRGDGGQNLIGSEKGAEIGIIRTQELLEARKIDGAEQFFTSAIDFGYSKTPDETFEFWGKETILSDVVWVIRKFQPDVIVTRFPPGRSAGHGHHTATGTLAIEAFKAAADPLQFPEQLRHIQPWQAKRIVWNSWRMSQDELKSAAKINIGEYEPLLGKSFSEIAAESRSMHKSQGFGSTADRGNEYEFFNLIDGEPFSSNIFDEIDISWNRIPGGKSVGAIIENTLNSFDPRNPALSTPYLIEAYNKLNALEKINWTETKQKELLRAIRTSAGLWIEAIADSYAGAPGSRIPVRTTLINRSNHPFELEKIEFSGIYSESNLNMTLSNNDPVSLDKTLHIPNTYPTSQPYWLHEEQGKGTFTIADQNLIGIAENPAAIQAFVTVSSNDIRLQFTVPLLYRWEDSVAGELYRPFEVRPLITANFEDKVTVFTNNQPKEIAVSLKGHSPDISGIISLKGPNNWKINPASISFSLSQPFDEELVTFSVTPPPDSDEAVFTTEVEVNGEHYTQSLVEISYPHITHQILFPENNIKMVNLDITKHDDTIGYIMGAGDEVPDGLRNLGYDVVLMNDDMLENGDLSQFDAIITGVRAYNTRKRLQFAQPRLIDYVKNGGTFIVQYNVASDLSTKQIGPYPFTIGRDRVSVETAPVSFLKPGHQLLNYPNKITNRDFEGWVQERGLYFATQWDNKYETIFSSHDPNESNKEGSLIFTRYGKGVFIYTGISWFRELPAGVPGAYRLFANLISAGKYSGN